MLIRLLLSALLVLCGRVYGAEMADARILQSTLARAGIDGSLRLIAEHDPALTRRLANLAYTVTGREQGGGFDTVQLDSEPLDRGLTLRIRYAQAKTGFETRLSVSLLGPGAAAFAAGYRIGIEFSPNDSFFPAPMPGFAGRFADVAVVYAEAGAQHSLEPEKASVTVGKTSWAGLRSRFQAVLLAAATPARLSAEWGPRGPRRVAVFAAPAGVLFEYRVYAGPIAADALSAVAEELRVFLFPHLWDWLRWLCFGLLYLLGWLYGLIGNYGLAVMALALTVKVLMLPLTALADHWQRQVNRIHSLLAPPLAEIKSRYRGEERHERELALYRQHKVHPFYTIKSLAGFLIQIPIFIAAFTMLGENYALHGVGFLWIDDLTRPDALLPLPFALPFFGDRFNLLPCLMTLVTVLASLAFNDESLSPDLQRRQRHRLYAMAALFFVLFYTFPAAMVLYWTTSNLLHLFKEIGKRLLRSA